MPESALGAGGRAFKSPRPDQIFFAFSRYFANRAPVQTAEGRKAAIENVGLLSHHASKWQLVPTILTTVSMRFIHAVQITENGRRVDTITVVKF